jgi:hypothetical protein
MALEKKVIEEHLLKSQKKQTIRKAVQHQNKIKFHAQTAITPTLSEPLTDHLKFVGALIPKAKFQMYKTLFRYPLKTNGVTGICFDKLSRVFDGRNPAFNYQFRNSEQRDDWEYYRQDVLNEPNVWHTMAWEYFKTEINSVLIVDLPVEQDTTDSYPQPYFYFLTIDNVLAYEVNVKTGIMNWIIFKQPGDKIAVFDAYDREVYEFKNNVVGEQVTTSPHDLGYCPARFFWNEPLNIRDPDVKSHPLTKELDSLEWFLFFSGSKKILDIFAAYPIYSGYAQDCNYHSDQDGKSCDGTGFLTNAKGLYELDQLGAIERCPRCYEKRIAGAGTFIEIPVPKGKPGDNDFQADLKNPVQLLGIDATSLTYSVEEESRLKRNIITGVVGVEGESNNDQAINEKQVAANFESQSAIVNRVKKGFEAAQQFVDETVCRSRYGNMFISAKINYGTEFFTMSADELRNLYKIAKESGASEAELDALHNQVVETEYRNNPTQLQRMYILSELEPYRHLTREEVLTLKDKGLITDEELHIKLKFPTFVRRFERENTNILEFGTQIAFDKKIETITNKFKEYASENITRV